MPPKRLGHNRISFMPSLYPIYESRKSSLKFHFDPLEDPPGDEMAATDTTSPERQYLQLQQQQQQQTLLQLQLLQLQLQLQRHYQQQQHQQHQHQQQQQQQPQQQPQQPQQQPQQYQQYQQQYQHQLRQTQEPDLFRELFSFFCGCFAIPTFSSSKQPNYQLIYQGQFQSPSHPSEPPPTTLVSTLPSFLSTVPQRLPSGTLFGPRSGIWIR